MGFSADGPRCQIFGRCFAPPAVIHHHPRQELHEVSGVPLEDWCKLVEASLPQLGNVFGPTSADFLADIPNSFQWWLFLQKLVAMRPPQFEGA